MESFYKQITDWLFVIAPGFIYLCSFFFLFLSFRKKYNLEFIKSSREYFPYIIILLIFFSYIVGMSIHLDSQVIIYFIGDHCKNCNYKFGCEAEKLIRLKINAKNIPDMGNVLIGSSYNVLVMFRHLFISTILLGGSLCYWFHKRKQGWLGWRILIFSCLFALMFLFAYCRQKAYHIKLKETFGITNSDK
jgi:hypothetical protein